MEVEESIEFSFDELSNKAKEQAREKWRESSLDYEWWGATYDDAVRIGALMGFEVGTHYYAAQHGVGPPRMFGKPDIWFCGFSSQGDGCCWSGHIVANGLAGAVERIKAEAPVDEDLHNLAARCEELFGMIASIAVANRLADENDDFAVQWPEVTLTMRIVVEGKERSYTTRTAPLDVPQQLEDFADELVEEFAHWIYTQLEREYEYLTSDEVIDAQLAEYDMSFDEDGNEL